MPAPLAGNVGTRDQAGAPGTRAPAPVTPGHGPAKPGRCYPAVAPAVHGPPGPPLPAQTGRAARAEIRGDRLRRLTGLLRRVPKTGGHRDSLFERPDLIEDDYYRFRPSDRRRPR